MSETDKPDLTEGGKKPEKREERRSDDQANRRRDGMFVAAYIMVGALIYSVVSIESISEFAQGVITLALGNFIAYLTGMYNYEIGATRGSAAKDAAITDMTKTAAVNASTAKDAQAASDKAIGLAMVSPIETTVAGLKAAAAATEKGVEPAVTPGPTTPAGIVPAAEVVQPGAQTDAPKGDSVEDGKNV